MTRVAAWKSFHWVASMLALGHASGGPMCPKGGLDPFWGCFEREMVAQRLDFEGRGLSLGSFWVPFECPRAPGHASGGFLCPRGGLDRFWEEFCMPSQVKREPKSLPNSIKKSMKFGVCFWMSF